MMSSTALMVYLIILLLMTLGIAWLMERTKKVIFKDGNVWGYRVLAALYVCIGVGFLMVSGIYQPILANLLGAKKYVDLIALLVTMWSLQSVADLYLVKKLLKATIETVAKKNGVSKEMLEAGEELMRLNEKKEK